MKKNCIRIWKALLLSTISVAISCNGPSASDKNALPVIFDPQYAEGFEIAGHPDSLSRVIRVTAPWQEADSTAMELFIRRGNEQIPGDFTGKIMEGNAERIAVMSSSHIAYLDLLGKVNTVKAVSGAGFISNSYIRSHTSEIADLGYDTALDLEKLAKIQPDIVLLYGIRGANPIDKKLNSLGIPYLYLGEYLETSPLAKTEWLYAFGELTGSGEEADSLFKAITARYKELESLVPEEAERPEVMLNIPYGTTWFMSSSISAMASLIHDAGADYIYKENRTNRSLPIDLEKAWLLASKADYWLNTGQIRTLDELISGWPQFEGIGCVKERKVWNCDLRTTPEGGNDFWESGAVRADLVLEDLIRIFHPEVLPADKDGKEGEVMHYYRNIAK